VRRSITTISALCAAALLTAGCGSSHRIGLSRSEIDTRANSICGAAQRQAQAVPAPANLSTTTVAAAYFDKVAPITDAETTAIAALKPGSAVAADWNAFMVQQQGANELLQEIRAKADAKDRAALQELQLISGVAQKVAAAARKAGATTCAR
jgi:hypothetical protein